MPQTNAMLMNAMSIDVEDYFQVSAFNGLIKREDWESMPSRLERNMDILLTMMDEQEVSATFFTLGWIAERFPTVVQRIAEQGHELACHGYDHQRIFSMTQREFASDIRRSKAVLEDIAGVSVVGYRAPSFSINSDCEWAYDELEKAGFLYSSSVYPIDHDHYGSSSLPRFPFMPRDGITEIPISTVRLFKRNWPAGGGGWFRLYPYWLSHHFIRTIHKKDHNPMVFYLHPWELDPGQPKPLGLDWRTRFRHYINLSRVERRLTRLLKAYRWGSLRDVYFTGRQPGEQAECKKSTSQATAETASITLGREAL